MDKMLSPTFVIVFLKAMLLGLTTKLPARVQTLELAGKTISVADIVTLIKQYLGIFEAVPSNRRLWRSSLNVRKDNAALVERFLDALEAAVKTVLGPDNPELAVFGVKLPKIRIPLTAEQKAERAKKAKATREARGTKGKRKGGESPGADAQPKPNN